VNPARPAGCSGAVQVTAPQEARHFRRRPLSHRLLSAACGGGWASHLPCRRGKPEHNYQVDACGRPPVPVICFGFLLVPSVSFHESGRPRRQYQAPQGVDKHSAMQLDGVGKSRGACAHDLGGACPLFCDRVPVILGSVCPLFWKRVPVILGACARYFESVCPLFLGVCPLFSDVCPLK